MAFTVNHCRRRERFDKDVQAAMLAMADGEERVHMIFPSHTRAQQVYDEAKRRFEMLGGSVPLNLADQPACGEAVRATRAERGLSLRDAASQIGIAFNVLTRIEHGENVRYDSMAKALRWCQESRSE